jgi:hypothetical protein
LRDRPRWLAGGDARQRHTAAERKGQSEHTARGLYQPAP